MSHIFISYDHEDRAYLSILLESLYAVGFREDDLWYDMNIRGGSNWRDEISDALDDAFAVIFIVTQQSIQSLYCTYEWAYAMGSGAPVLPALFGDVAVADVPAPLAAMQFIVCRDSVPPMLTNRLHDMQMVSPEETYINSRITRLVMEFRVLARVASWLYRQPQRSRDTILYTIVDTLLGKAQELYIETLPELLVSHAYAFSTRQKRACRVLIQHTHAYWEAYYEHSAMGFFTRRPLRMVMQRAETIRTELLEPAIQVFEIGHSIEKTYRTFDGFLSAMETGSLTTDETNLSTLIMDWILPNDIAEKIKVALESSF